MDSMIKKKLMKNIGKDAKIVLKNNFYYRGKIIQCDDESVEILDYKTGFEQVLDLDDIKHIGVKK